MGKIKLISLAIFLLAITLIIGCSKSDKDVSKTETKKNREQLDTSKFYISSDSKYWQNYPGKGPDGSDMVELKDNPKIEKIEMSIKGESSEDVYTCEMHPQVHQNYAGKCPVCKMDLIKQEKNK